MIAHIKKRLKKTGKYVMIKFKENFYQICI